MLLASSVGFIPTSLPGGWQFASPSKGEAEGCWGNHRCDLGNSCSEYIATFTWTTGINRRQFVAFSYCVGWELPVEYRLKMYLPDGIGARLTGMIVRLLGWNPASNSEGGECFEGGTSEPESLSNPNIQSDPRNIGRPCILDEHYLCLHIRVASLFCADISLSGGSSLLRDLSNDSYGPTSTRS